MDTYQAIYDAVRSRISGENFDQAVQRALDISFQAEQAKESVRSAAAQYERPSTMFRPALSIDGNKWCALYGDNLQDGVAGFGDSPAEAMWDFDINWSKKLEPKEKQ